MDVIECLAVLHEENMAMVKRLLRPVDKGGYPTDKMPEITLTWLKQSGEILTPISTPTDIAALNEKEDEEGVESE